MSENKNAQDTQDTRENEYERCGICDCEFRKDEIADHRKECLKEYSRA